MACRRKMKDTHATFIKTQNIRPRPTDCRPRSLPLHWKVKKSRGISPQQQDRRIIVLKFTRNNITLLEKGKKKTKNMQAVMAMRVVQTLSYSHRLNYQIQTYVIEQYPPSANTNIATSGNALRLERAAAAALQKTVKNRGIQQHCVS